MRLNEFQNQFKGLMLDHPDALNHPPATLTAFCEGGKISLPERLKVYRNNIIGSLTDAIIASFPILEKLVGREFLTMMARSFILKHPPMQGCLNLYGAGFAEFIENFEPAQNMLYLPDMARLEIALNQAYYAVDDQALSPESLATIPQDALTEIKLPLRANVFLLSSPYPLIAIRDFCLTEEQEDKLDLDQGGVQVMISRPDLECQIAPLEPEEFEMLRLLRSGHTLGEAFEHIMHNNSAFDFAGFLQKHIALQTFLERKNDA